MITDLFLSLLECSKKKLAQMKFAFQLFALTAAMIMMISAAPSKMACHTLFEAHTNDVCKEYCGSSGYILGECGTGGVCIHSNKSTIIKMASITHTSTDSTRSRPVIIATTRIFDANHSQGHRISSKTASKKETNKGISKRSTSKSRSKSATKKLTSRIYSNKHQGFTKTNITFTTVKATITKTGTIKAFKASALARMAALGKKRVAAVYTTIPSHNKRSITSSNEPKSTTSA